MHCETLLRHLYRRSEFEKLGEGLRLTTQQNGKNITGGTVNWGVKPPNSLGNSHPVSLWWVQKIMENQHYNDFCCSHEISAWPYYGSARCF